MTCFVHEFDAREGGRFRVSLTCEEPTGDGKTTAHTDTYRGRFTKLVPHEQIVEVVEFETSDPALCGKMTLTTTLTDAGGGTDLLTIHEALPPGLSPIDNELGWRVVTQFEIGAHVLTAGGPRHTQAMRPLQAVKLKLSHSP